MIWYKLKLSFRSLLKDKLNSIINIFGLGVGIAAVILISIYVQHELSYDKFNSKHERIHRLITQIGLEQLNDYPICCRINHRQFSENIPGLEEITQLYRGSECEIINNNTRFFDFDLKFVDANFNKVFDLHFLRGNPNTAFTDPKSIVINEKTALTIFGNMDVLGKQVSLNGIACTISGVIENIPYNSHYSADVMAPLEYLYSLDSQSGLEFFTYALIKEDANEETTLKNIHTAYLKVLEKFKNRGYKTGTYFQKLTDIHLHSSFSYELKANGSYTTVLTHLFLAILILFIAIINFINIMTVQYENKIKEIGMRKAIGASRMELIRLFVGNSILLTLISMIIGVIFAEIFLSHFENLIHRNLSLDYRNNLLLSLGIPSSAIIVGLISGIYPAVIISKPAPAIALNGGGIKINGKNVLTKFLVVFQFTVSLILISSLIILNQQVTYFKKADLGFNPHNVIAITNLNTKLNQSYYSIKQELLKNPFLKYVSASDHIPGGGHSGQAFTIVGKEKNNVKPFNSYRIQPDYFKTVGIELKEGKTFKNNNNFKQKGIIINEAGVKFLNVDQVVGLNVNYQNEVHEIIGVVKDFNYTSLHSKISPLMFTHNSFGMLSDILIRYEGHDLQYILEEVTKVFQKFDPGYILGYEIIEDFCHNRYRSEENSVQLASYASILSLVLALLGLYSLSLFMVQKRTKEIGIRKVNGATIWQVSSLLFTTFSKWIGIAFIIAVPISWYVMQNWLEQFAYRIEIGIMPFVISGLVTSIFALATIGWQTWKTANRNPVESLRYE